MFNLKKSLLLVSLLGLIVSVEAAKRKNSSCDKKPEKTSSWFGGVLKKRPADKQEECRAEHKKKRAAMTQEQKDADKSARKARRANMTNSRKKSHDEARSTKRASTEAALKAPYALPQAEVAANRAAVINARDRKSVV